MSIFELLAEEDSTEEAKALKKEQDKKLFKRYHILLQEIESEFKDLAGVENEDDRKATYKKIGDIAYEITFKAFRDEKLKAFCKTYLGSSREYSKIKPYIDADVEIKSPIVYDLENCRILFDGGKFQAIMSEDFLIYANYCLKDEEDNTRWILELKRRTSSETIELSNKELSSAKDLKSILLAKKYSLVITEVQLSHLHNHLLKQLPKDAKKVTRYGYDKDSDSFVYANAVLYKEKLHRANINGIVSLGDIAISMPIFDQEKADKYWFRYIKPEKDSLNFQKWFYHFCLAHTIDVGIPVVCHYIFSLFRDIIVDMEGASPILFLKGPYGSGKSAIARNILTLFGIPPRDSNLNLANNVTKTALTRTLSQYSNFPLWVDEYKTGHPVEGALQAAYDNSGVVKAMQRGGDFNTGNQTETTEIRSSLLMTTNYFPDNEPFFSRVLYINVYKQKRSEEQKVNFEIIHRYEEVGLSHLTGVLQKHREIIRKEFKKEFNKIKKILTKGINIDNVSDRLIINQAIIIAPFIIVNRAEQFAVGILPKDNFENYIFNMAIKQIENQHHAMGDNSSLRIYFEIMYRLKCDGKLFFNKEYKFKLDKDTGEECLVLRVGGTYSKFKDYYQRTYHQPAPDKKSIEDEMAKFLGKEGQNIYSQDTLMPFNPRGGDDFETKKPKLVGQKDCVRFPYWKIYDTYNVNFHDSEIDNSRLEDIWSESSKT